MAEVTIGGRTTEPNPGNAFNNVTVTELSNNRVGLDFTPRGGPDAPSETPEIFNLAVGSSEISFVFPNNTKRFVIRNRNNGKIFIAWAAAETASKFITIDQGVSYEESKLNLQSVTIFLLSDKTSQTVELQTWR